MDLHFLPAHPAGELRALDEAIGLAVTGHAALDLVAYTDDNGNLVKYLRVGRKLRTIGYHIGFTRARETLGEALKASEIHVLVQDRISGKFHRVPRLYWFHHEPLSPILQLDVDHPAYSSLNNQPLVVDMDGHQAWIDIAQPKKATAPTESQMDEHNVAGQREVSLPASNTNRTGLPGRPTSVHLLEAILEQRHANGSMIHDNLAGECREVVRIFRADAANAHLPPPTEKTTANRLRNLYRRLERTTLN